MIWFQNRNSHLLQGLNKVVPVLLRLALWNPLRGSQSEIPQGEPLVKNLFLKYFLDFFITKINFS